MVGNHCQVVKGHQMVTKTFALNLSTLISLHPGQRGVQLRVRQGSLRGIVSCVNMICFLMTFFEHSLISSIICCMIGLSATAAPTFTPVPGGSPVSRIKLYWQKGFTWQESKDEERYCLQCRNWKGAREETCDWKQKIELYDCNNRLRQKFVRVESDKSIRPAMSPHLCISHQNHADDIYLDTLTLEYCNGGKQQRFDIVGTPWQKNGKFEIRVSRSNY